MALSGTVEMSFVVATTGTVGLIANEKDSLSHRLSHTFSDGAGALQATQVYHATRTLSGTSEELDLAGGLSMRGTTLTFAEIKGLLVTNNHASQDLTLGNATSNAWTSLLGATGTLVVKPGATVALVATDATGYTVTAGTGDILKVAGANAQTYNIIILGN